MNQAQHNYKANTPVFDEIYSGYISYSTLMQFIEADQYQDEKELNWLELNLVAIERYIKQGHIFEIQAELETIALHTKNEFYLLCKKITPTAYNLFLRDRHL